MRLCEKRILNATVASLRARLGPIRGVPTKGGGMQVGRGRDGDLPLTMSAVLHTF